MSVGVDDFIIRSLQSQVRDLQNRLLEVSSKVVLLRDELAGVRSDNATLKDLNEQFARENIRLRRLLVAEKRRERRETAT